MLRDENQSYQFWVYDWFLYPWWTEIWKTPFKSPILTMKTLRLYTESTSRSEKFIFFSCKLMEPQYYLTLKIKPIVGERRPRNTETCLKAHEATLLKAIPAFVKEPGQIISSSMWSDLWFSWIHPKDSCPLWCDEPLACLFGTWMWEPCTGPNGAANLSESLIRIAERGCCSL